MKKRNYKKNRVIAENCNTKNITFGEENLQILLRLKDTSILMRANNKHRISLLSMSGTKRAKSKGKWKALKGSKL